MPSLRANGSRECAPDDRLREAIHQAEKQEWIASLQSLSSGAHSTSGECRGGQSHASGPASPRSPQMTIFWHCGLPALSSKTALETHFRQPTVNGFGRGCCSKGSGSADSQRFAWSSGGSGDGRSCPGDSGCVRAHPADWRASASYRPLRAVWAVCAWALRGCARSPEPFSAQECSARP